MKNTARFVAFSLIFVAAISSTPAAEMEPATPAREFIENLNKTCDHQARIPASVRVIGKVAKPGRYEMKTSDTVWAVLERAVMDPAAGLNQIVLIRRDADGNEGRHILNWDKREEYGVAPLLCDGDVLYVPAGVD